MRQLRMWGLGLAALLATAFPAAAQQQVLTVPLPALSGDASGTITTTNTFQKIWGASGLSGAPTTGSAGARHGCSVQNNGSHTMYVTESTGVAASTTSNSWQIPSSGGVFNCNFGGVVLSGEIDITGTSGDAFVAKQF